MMLPVAGEEVIVGFEHGDPSVPYVLGSLFNGKDKPGDELAAQDGSFALKSDHKALIAAQEDITLRTEKGKWIVEINAGEITETVKAPGNYTGTLRRQARAHRHAGDDARVEPERVDQGAVDHARGPGIDGAEVERPLTVEAQGMLELKGATVRSAAGGREHLGRHHQPRIGSDEHDGHPRLRPRLPPQVDRRGGIALGARRARTSTRRSSSSSAPRPASGPMRPEFGCGVHDFVFDTIDAATVGAHGDRDPRARSTAGSRGSRSRTSTSTSSRVDDGQLLIDIGYRVRATNNERNLVYPFYVIPAEETE